MTYQPTKPQEVIINGRKCIEVDAVKIFEMASLHERMNPPKGKK